VRAEEAIPFVYCRLLRSDVCLNETQIKKLKKNALHRYASDVPSFSHRNHNYPEIFQLLQRNPTRTNSIFIHFYFLFGGLQFEALETPRSLDIVT
jgi:hypothetical protein